MTAVGATIKLDEDLSLRVGEPLVRRGFSVHGVVEQGWKGVADSDLHERVKASEEILFTADKGFGDLRRYPPGTHPGIVLLRPDRDSVVELTDLVEQLLIAVSLGDIAGCVVVVSPRSIRIRRPDPET